MTVEEYRRSFSSSLKIQTAKLCNPKTVFIAIVVLAVLSTYFLVDRLVRLSVTEKIMVQDNSSPAALQGRHGEGKSGSTRFTGAHKGSPKSAALDKILFWEGGPISDVTPHWQRLDNNSDAYLYSAHYDDLEISPVIRIVGLARKPLRYDRVLCTFYENNGDVIDENILGILYHFRNIRREMYIGVFVVCPLGEGMNLPYSVTVVKDRYSSYTTFFKVHYSQTNQSTIKPEAKASGGKTVGENVTRRWNVTRCFPAFHSRYNDFTGVAEMVAASKVFGVERFVFYMQSLGPELKTLLQVLVEEGVAEVYPWNLHLIPPDNVHYKAQFPAIQDCLYRHLHSSRYLLFGDVDEMFVPKSTDSLLTLLDEHFTKNPACGTFLFRNVFFDLRSPARLPHTNDTRIASFLRQHPMKILTHTTREKRAWPAEERSKPAVDPRKVSVASVHVVEKLRVGFHSCVMRVGEGLLHHYRDVTDTTRKGRTEDTSLWQRLDVIVEDTNRMLERMNDTVRDHSNGLASSLRESKTENLIR